MRIYILFALLIITTGSFAQDIIVLKKGETEIKCRILTVNDTAIVYRKWNTPGTAKYSVKRNEVLSYMLEKGKSKSRTKESSADSGAEVKKTGGLFKIKKKEDPDKGLLEKYHSDATVDGYVILNSGDTVPGSIAVKNVAMNQLAVAFQDPAGFKKEYTHFDLKGYAYADVEYETVKTGYTKNVINDRSSSDGILFLHREVNGKAKLYRMYRLKFSKTAYAYYPDPPSYFGKLKRYFVIDNGSGKIVVTKGNKLRGTLIKLFGDDPVLKDDVLNEWPNTSDLERLIQGYNDRHR